MKKVFYDIADIKEKYIAHIDWIDKNDSAKGFVIQTVEEHLNGVANFAESTCSGINIGNTGKLLGLLHDMGKYSNKFQDRIRNSFLGKDAEKVDHSAAGALWLYNNAAGCINIPARYIIREILANILMGHHHGLYDMQDGQKESPFLKRIKENGKDKQLEDCSEYFKHHNETDLKMLLRKSVEELSKVIINIKNTNNDGYGFYFHIQNLVRLIYSHLIDADWYDTANWNANKYCWQEIDNFCDWKLLQNKLHEKYASFGKPVGKINEYRTMIADDCEIGGANKSGIYTLSVPTGAGKTLASMRYALAHAMKYNKKRIIEIVPYTAIIDQNVNEIKKVLENGVDREIVYAHHSNVDYDCRIKPDNNGFYDWEDVYKRNYVTQRWDAPIIFSTMVQFLEIITSYRSQAARRMQGLENSVIIFDEIQSLPSKYTYIFNETINFLKNSCNCSIVLCTATQPGLDSGVIKRKAHIDGEIANNLNDIFNIFSRVDVDIDLAPVAVDVIATEVIKKLEIEDSALVIMNTTISAKDMYDNIKSRIVGKNIKLLYLTTKLTMADRTIILNRIKKILKNNIDNDNKQKIICVTTQLIEAGVDVSFNCVYRSLAGLASVAQSAGRCNRNGEMDHHGYVKVFYLGDNENIKPLKEIIIQQEIMKRMFCQNAQYSNEDIKTVLTNQSIIEDYFKQLYDKLRMECGSKLLEYPSTNKDKADNGQTMFKRMSIPCSKMDLKQLHLSTGIQYESAYSKMRVIDTEQIPVFIDINNSHISWKSEYTKKMLRENELIKTIIDKYEPDDAWQSPEWRNAHLTVKKMMRIMNKYVVNVYQYNIDKLEELDVISLNAYGIYELTAGNGTNYIDTGLITTAEEINIPEAIVI